MVRLEKLMIRGIRSYNPNTGNTIEFSSPLTLIVGQNGSGKTTIIESLKFVTTNDLPSNSRGGAFIYDPKLLRQSEVKAQVKLKFVNINGVEMVCTRSLQATQKLNNLTQKTIDSTLFYKDKNEPVSVSNRCLNIDSEMQHHLGVSSAILQNVIFCHQEESNWILSEPANVKRRLDDIFATSKYSKALEGVKSSKKEASIALKMKGQELDFLADKKMKKERLEMHVNELCNKLRVINVEIRDTDFENEQHEVMEVKSQLKIAEELENKKVKISAEIEMLKKSYLEEDIASGNEVSVLESFVKSMKNEDNDNSFINFLSVIEDGKDNNNTTINSYGVSETSNKHRPKTAESDKYRIQGPYNNNMIEANSKECDYASQNKGVPEINKSTAYKHEIPINHETEELYSINENITIFKNNAEYQLYQNFYKKTANITESDITNYLSVLKVEINDNLEYIKDLEEKSSIVSMCKAEIQAINNSCIQNNNLLQNTRQRKEALYKSIFSEIVEIVKLKYENKNLEKYIIFDFSLQDSIQQNFMQEITQNTSNNSSFVSTVNINIKKQKSDLILHLESCLKFKENNFYNLNNKNKILVNENHENNSKLINLKYKINEIEKQEKEFENILKSDCNFENIFEKELELEEKENELKEFYKNQEKHFEFKNKVKEKKECYKKILQIKNEVFDNFAALIKQVQGIRDERSLCSKDSARIQYKHNTAGASYDNHSSGISYKAQQLGISYNPSGMQGYNTNKPGISYNTAGMHVMQGPTMEGYNKNSATTATSPAQAFYATMDDLKNLFLTLKSIFSSKEEEKQKNKLLMQILVNNLESELKCIKNIRNVSEIFEIEVNENDLSLSIQNLQKSITLGENALLLYQTFLKKGVENGICYICKKSFVENDKNNYINLLTNILNQIPKNLECKKEELKNYKNKEALEIKDKEILEAKNRIIKIINEIEECKSVNKISMRANTNVHINETSMRANTNAHRGETSMRANTNAHRDEISMRANTNAHRNETSMRANTNAHRNEKLNLHEKEELYGHKNLKLNLHENIEFYAHNNKNMHENREISAPNNYKSMHENREIAAPYNYKSMHEQEFINAHNNNIGMHEKECINAHNKSILNLSINDYIASLKNTSKDNSYTGSVSLSNNLYNLLNTFYDLHTHFYSIRIERIKNTRNPEIIVEEIKGLKNEIERLKKYQSIKLNYNKNNSECTKNECKKEYENIFDIFNEIQEITKVNEIEIEKLKNEIEEIKNEKFVQKTKLENYTKNFDRIKNEIIEIEKENKKLERKENENKIIIENYLDKVKYKLTNNKSAKKQKSLISDSQETRKRYKEGNKDLEYNNSLVNSSQEYNNQDQLHNVQGYTNTFMDDFGTAYNYIYNRLNLFDERISKRIVAFKEKIVKLNENYNNLYESVNKIKKMRRKFEDDLLYKKLNNEIQKLAKSNIEVLKNNLVHLENLINNKKYKQAMLEGEKKQLEESIIINKKSLKEEYHKIVSKYTNCYIEIKALEFIIDDIDKCIKALDRSIVEFHSSKIDEVNWILKDLWINTYKGNDIDYIELKSETNDNKVYNYKLVMYKNNVELDLRGRCSSGQKVLTSILMRLALNDAFTKNCSVMALDEPTTNLDKENIEALAHTLKNIINKRKDNTDFQFILITHDETFVEIMCRDECEHYYQIKRNEYGDSEICKQTVY